MRRLDLLRCVSSRWREQSELAAVRRIISVTVGASVGRAIAESFTIAPARNRTASRGANAKNLSGGTRKNGPASTLPDFQGKSLPIIEPRGDETGLDGQRGDAPFILHEDGLGWMYVPKGLQDGPFPTHYEPLESPVRNPLYSRDTNPAVNWFTRNENRFAPPGDPRFPFVLTTYRLTEHHTGGGMSRFLSHLSELQPEMFVEISPELAAKLKIGNSDYVCIVSLRGAIEARALVSRRIRPLNLNGKTVHQVAIPFHFGAAGPLRGNAANNLVAISGEPNVTIMESKALVCNIIPGRLPRGPAFLDWLERNAPQAGQPPNLHPEQPPPGAPTGGRFSRSHGREGKNGMSGIHLESVRPHSPARGMIDFLHRRASRANALADYLRSFLLASSAAW